MLFGFWIFTPVKIAQVLYTVCVQRSERKVRSALLFTHPENKFGLPSELFGLEENVRVSEDLL